MNNKTKNNKKATGGKIKPVDDKNGHNYDNRSKKHCTLIAIILVFLLIILFVICIYCWRSYSAKYSNAQQACSSTSAELNKYSKEYNDLLSGKAVDASKITTEQVADAKTVEILASDIKVKVPALSSCNGKSINTLTDSTNSINKQTNWFKSHIELLNKAIKAVDDSKTQKDKEIADTKAKADAEFKAKAEQETQQAQQTQQSVSQTRPNVSTTTRKTNATYRTSTNKSNASNYRPTQTTTTRPNLNGGYGCGNNCPPASSDGKIHR